MPLNFLLKVNWIEGMQTRPLLVNYCVLLQLYFPIKFFFSVECKQKIRKIEKNNYPVLNVSATGGRHSLLLARILFFCFWYLYNFCFYCIYHIWDFKSFVQLPIMFKNLHSHIIKITQNGFTTLTKVSLVLISQNKNQPVFVFCFIWYSVCVCARIHALVWVPQHTCGGPREPTQSVRRTHVPRQLSHLTAEKQPCV